MCAQSLAHKASAYAIIDPAYNATVDKPARPIGQQFTWLYGPAELECYRLKLLRERKDSARLNVGYTGNFHDPFTEGSFTVKLTEPRHLLQFRFKATGHGKLYVNGQLIGSFKDSHDVHAFSLKGINKVSGIKIVLSASEALPALLVISPALNKDQDKWQWQGPLGEAPLPAYGFTSDKNMPPHELEAPTVKVIPNQVSGNLFDFGRELIGHVFIEAGGTTVPVMRAGESTLEAMASGHEEQSSDLVQVGKGRWRTKTPVAFRYVRVANLPIDKIWTEASFHPETYKGAFACSDTLLTRIWMNSAYTLRLCMQDFLLDGVKRDRLPWAGDLAMSSLADAYSFGDGELIRRSLVALGRAGIADKDINGIIDFSLWWIIAEDQYQLYFADKEHLKSAWPQIQAALQVLLGQTNKNGLLVPRKGTRLFIDWVKQEKWTTLQVLWWWAQKSAARLAYRVGDTAGVRFWDSRCAGLKDQLYATLWNTRGGYWYAKDSLSPKTRHPNFFAVVSGLTGSRDKASIGRFLLDSTVQPVGTPYMEGFEMMGLAKTGEISAMIEKVKAYWGGMLKAGATTFWEAYNVQEKGPALYSFYNRPYGKSLCHAWSSGPAAFLPAEIFGLRPVEDAWKRFVLRPDLGTLTWASTCVPTPHGAISVDVKGDNLTVQIPGGTALQWGSKVIKGPFIFKSTINR